MGNLTVTSFTRYVGIFCAEATKIRGMDVNKLIDLADVLSEKNKNIGTDAMVRMLKYCIWRTVKLIHDQNSKTAKKDVANPDPMLNKILFCLEDHLKPKRYSSSPSFYFIWHAYLVSLCISCPRTNSLKYFRKDGKAKMNVKDFREFVQRFDENEDGKISRKELQQALNALGIPQSGLEAWYAILRTDKNSSGFIEGDLEWKELLKHADKYWAIFNRCP